MTDKILVLTTTGSNEEARRIADALVEGHLAACVNILKGVESIYRWKGKTEESQEWMLLIKTTAAGFDRVQETIKKLNSYELPECLRISIEDGSAEYLNWIAESVKQTK
jgi:periplasmic divalent cation tolerance protein